MSTEVIVYILTALAAVVIVLTRLRLGRGDRGAGRLQMGGGLVHLHTVAGALALVLWVVFLVADEDSAAGSEVVGIIALACWWVVVVAGLLILVRWLPTRGKHASDGQEDSWSDGPGLSILAHVGMLVGVSVFTWAYLTAVV
ncbi:MULTISPECIES: hypothetical protein [unclassified Nocardioides]|uniref:hypothetical protein n=1 Tax=unclassified Nocardioides TaxID=2615069 RepID=UPI0009F0AC90|nr:MULTISPECIES: hypothetical protein [unclassified Nocardioides]GAW52438.1 uncharacterized protein PD653B2_4795 [Nocardioides sp. PD653-B2]GAW55617.1 uncharacterized protein PD653_3042 [Nocardioides sp. PD653]